jgi:hypothetical protein
MPLPIRPFTPPSVMINQSCALALVALDAQAKASTGGFVPVALFCGVGLLLSLAVLILDQYAPGDWF